MQEGEAVQGLHVIRLLQWFIQPSSGTTPEADPYQYIAYILTNISQVWNTSQYHLCNTSIVHT